MVDTVKRQAASTAIPVALVRKLIHRGARANLSKIFARAFPVEVARLLSNLGVGERAQAFAILLEEADTAHVAAVLSEMAPEESIALLEEQEPDSIARLLNELPADDATYLASRLPDPLKLQVLSRMEAEPAADVRELLEHEERTAGRIMTPDVFALEEDVTVSEAITELQKRSEEFEMAFYLYVVDKRDHLIGVVSLRKLLTTPPSTQLKRIMSPEVISVRTDEHQEDVARKVAEYNLLAIPVVDEEGKLVGIVTVDDVIDVMQDEVAEDLLALAGVATEERVTTPPSKSLRLRTPWLLINLATAFLASWVVNQFSTTIGEFPVLAALMPIVAGMGGNSATQTLTVIIRGIALGEVTAPRLVALRQFLIGLGSGLINGLVCGAAVAVLFEDFWLGLVIGLAMVANLVVAGIAGTVVPIALKRLNVDPAIASAVFVTTCTDVTGFFTFLGLATLFMTYLKG